MASKTAKAKASATTSDEESQGEDGIPLTGTLQAEEYDSGDFDGEEDEEEEQSAASGGGRGDNASSAATTRKRKRSSTIRVTFEFRDPHPDMTSAVQTFLRSFLPTHELDRRQLAEVVAAQAEIGTVVVQEGEDDAFAFVSAVNMNPSRGLRCLDQVRDLLIDKCPAGLRPQLQETMRQPGTGLFINQRMINFPPKLVPSMTDSLRQDMEWALETAENPQEEAEFRFDALLVVSPCCAIDPDAALTATQSSKRARTAANATSTSTTPVYFDRFEEEDLTKDARLAFSFETEDTHGQPKSMLVSVVDREVFDRNASDLAAALGTGSSA